MLESIILFLKSFVLTYGAVGLFLVMVLQAVVAPLPSDVFIVLAVILGMNPVLVVVSGALGSTVGGLIDFYLVRKGGRPYLLRIMGTSRVQRIERWFERWGSWTLVLGRATPFISSDALAYFAGATRMTCRDFCLYGFLGAVLRCTILVLLGSLLLSILPWTL
jgi:uncharacterized membrane protein YdjX (TVP38/TMEM64 family)